MSAPREPVAVAAAAPDDGVAVAVLFARGGRLPVGAAEAAAEAGGDALVVGNGAEQAAATLAASGRVRWCETGAFRPAALAAALAGPLAPSPLVILPGSPDGRDLAPRLAAALDRPLYTDAVRVSARRAELLRLDGRVLVDANLAGPAVATLVPGARTAPPAAPVAVEPLALDLPPAADPDTLELVEPTPETIDLAVAPRVLAGGAGLAAGADDPRATFALLTQVAAALNAASGATRVATDAGWAAPERQIGTTGVAVDPELYVALGISGAAQHVGGLGEPRHIVSVNLDPSCPMTALADLGIVADARGVLEALAERVLDA